MSEEKSIVRLAFAARTPRVRSRRARVVAQSLDRVGPTDSIIACDEFAAMLDRVSAAVVARALRRIIDQSKASAVVATSHDDLVRALGPDAIVRCDFDHLTVEKGAAINVL